MRYYLLKGQIWGFDVVVAAHDLEVWCEAAEEGVGGAVGEVAEAEDLADFAGGEEFLEFGG